MCSSERPSWHGHFLLVDHKVSIVVSSVLVHSGVKLVAASISSVSTLLVDHEVGIVGATSPSIVSLIKTNVDSVSSSLELDSLRGAHESQKNLLDHFKN